MVFRHRAAQNEKEVQDAAVVAMDFEGADSKTICCAYVPPQSEDLSPAALKRRLALVLPRYMIPERWIILQDMPHNGNGKADRTLLKEMFRQDAATPRETPKLPETAAPRKATVSQELTLTTTLLHAN